MQIPLHYQIADYLLFMLQKGDLNRNDKLPTEEKLTEIFDVSRTTIRKALDQLLNKKLIYKKQGRGTFWTEITESLTQKKLSGINRQIFAITEKTDVTVLSKKQVSVSGEIADFLGLPGGSRVVEFERLRFINNEPMSYTINYLPVSIGEPISKEQLEKKTMLETLEADFKIDLGIINHEVEITRANSVTSEFLKIAVLDPVLTIKTSVFDSLNNPIEIVWTYFVENKYKFKVVLDNDKSKVKNQKSKLTL